MDPVEESPCQDSKRDSWSEAADCRSLGKEGRCI